MFGSQVPKAPEIAYFKLEPPEPSVNVKATSTPIDGVGKQTSANIDPVIELQKPKTVDIKPAAKTVTKKQPKAISTDKPKLDSNAIPIAWVLQVASFSHRDKADKLREALIKMGYKADTRVIRSGSAKMVRVGVGPKFNKQSLVEAKTVIDKRFRVKSLIVRYVP